MVNRKKLQQVLFLLMFFNCIVVIFITSVAMYMDYWVIARPYRQISTIIVEGTSKHHDANNTNSSASNQTVDFVEDIEIDLFDEEEDLLPIDLYANKDCKRYNGKIRFGLFKGVWLLNYAYGCKNRVNRVYIMDMLTKHKLFDQTLWISTILCCSLALFCTTLSGIFSFVNVFISPNRAMNGPIGMYLWNALSGIFHVLALIMFTFEFYLYINKNVLTKDEIESGWTSTNRAKLGWSFYILFLSILFIFANIGLIYATVRLKRSFIDLKNQYETNMNLINGDGNILISCAKQPPPSHLLQSVSKSSDYQQITEPNLNINEINLAATSSGAGQFQNNYAFNLRTDEMRSSKKLKRIVDFIY